MNPLAAALSYLRGDDLKRLPVETPAPPIVEQKYGFTTSSYIGGWPVPGHPTVLDAIRMGVLVHGPGASELYSAAYGYGADANSAVFACLNKLCTAYGEPPLRVYQGDAEGGEPEVIADHPLEELVADPNPSIPGPILWYWVQWAKHVAGNAYLRKVRAGAGNVVELWPISPMLIKPITTDTDRERGIFISAYRWEYETGKFEDLDVEDVVHFRLGLNDHDNRVGCSPLQRLGQEIYGDDQAQRWTAGLLGNMAIPGTVVQVPKETPMTLEQAQDLESKVNVKFSGDRRGMTSVLTGGATMAQFGFSPEQMNLTALHRVPEERISAVLGVPAIVAGLGAGLDRATYSNFGQALEAFTSTTLVPLWTADASTMNQQLLPDFAGEQRGKRGSQRLFSRFDLTNVRALQEDEDKKYARLNQGVLGGWVKPEEARRDTGFGDEPGLEGILYISNSVTPTPVEEVGTPPPAPVPPAAPVPPQQPPQDGQPPDTQAGKALRALLDTKARRVPLADFPELLAALADLAEPGLTRDLVTYFDGQQERVKRRLLASEPNPQSARASLPKLNGIAR